MSIEKCQNCSYLNPVMYHCGKYLRGCETAIYLCSREQPQTNADRIHAMTDEELAEIMVGDCPPNYPHGNCREYEKFDGNLDCCKCWLNWLKSPVEVDENGN